MIWQNVDEIYIEPTIVIKKGSILTLKVSLAGDFNQFESNIVGIKAALRHWCYFHEGKEISPLRLLEYSRRDQSFEATLEVVKKSKEIDEMKLLCQDILDVLNLENISVTKWDILV
jgi:hypothetical protein